MANFTVNTSKAAIEESSGGSYIGKSGIYDVTIKFASVDVSKGGAESVNFNIDYSGNSQTIYGPYIQSKAGDTLEIGMKLINKALVIAGLRDGDVPSIEEEMHIVGKDNEEKEFAVITDLSDLDIKIRLQEEYSRHYQTGDVTKRLVIKNFFDAEGGSAQEIIDDTEKGVQLAKDEKYKDNITYRDSAKGANDAPTPEDVADWLEAKKAGTAPAKGAAKPAAAKVAPKRATFK